MRLLPSNPKTGQTVGWGIIIVSVALHGVALKLPMRPLGTLQVPEPEPPELVPVTRLPVEAEPLPEVEPEPPADPPAPEPQPAEDVVVAQAAAPATVPEPMVQAPEPDRLEPAPDGPPDVPPESEPPTDPPLEGGAVVPFADDFPHLGNAEMGCFGLSSCGSLSGVGSFRSEAEQLLPALEAQNYQVDEYSTDEPGYLVYRLSHPDWRDGESYYLSFFQDGLGQAVYVITVNAISLAELKQLV